MIKVGSDFSGVGAFNQALNRLGIEYKEVFACDMDKHARQTFVYNYGEPEYYPENVYNREIPADPLDIYMTSPPCQAFSLAGKRKGKDDLRGILFFNSLEFIAKNKPRFFIFENVKGLLSDDGGKTFSEWVNMLGGKSVNGLPVLFPYEESVPYHLYWQVLNAKNHGVPQNRERVFLIGIRDDADNRFQFPREEHLIKRLKDVLEDEVNEKYFLSSETIDKLIAYDKKQKENGNGFGEKFHDENGTMSALKVGGGGCDDLVKIKSATSKGYEEATELDTSYNQRVIQLNPSLESGGKQPYQQNRIYDSNGINPALNAGQSTWGGNIVTIPLDIDCNQATIIDCYNNQIRKDGLCGTITQHCSRSGMTNGMKLIRDYKIRRLTPRECFRLMDFPDTFTWPVSDSQAYKQAGNSIVVNVLYKILKNLPL